MKADKMEAKSAHILAWPFRFEMERKEMIKKVEEKGWVKKSLDFRDSKRKMQEEIDCFMLHQYLSLSARKIFIDKEKEAICSIYQYPMIDESNYQYIIKKKKEEYCLPIATIELHIYDYGVGILFIQVWNEKKKEENGNEKEENEKKGYNIGKIKKINDWGRRVSIPYLAEDGLLCADCIGIRTDTDSHITNFKDKVDNYFENNEGIDELCEPAAFLYDILNCDLETNDGSKDKKGLPFTNKEVIPFADDRMFLCSIIRDAGLSECIKNGTLNEELLYSILFVDSGDASCQNKEMRKKLLEDAVYARWSDYGTLYGVTSYSLFCITTDDVKANVEPTVVRPFLLEYSYFISLVLAQRIGMMSFTVRAEEIIKNINKPRKIRRGSKKGMGYFQALKFSKIQAQYIDFKNRLLILEASNQEQGIEIYKLLQKQMLVKEEQEILDGQLQSLYEAANISVGNGIAKAGVLLSCVALLPTLIEYFPTLTKMVKCIYNFFSK